MIEKKKKKNIIKVLNLKFELLSAFVAEQEK